MESKKNKNLVIENFIRNWILEIRNSKKAFTLIELLIVIAIIGIMSSVVFVSMQNSKTETELKTAAREVAAAIREAQNNALTGKMIDGEIAGLFDIVPSDSTNGYQMKYQTKVGDGWEERTVYSKNIKEGLTFTDSSSQRVRFNVPYGNVSIVGNGFQIKSNNGKFIWVCVSKSGNITETEIGKNCP